MSKSQGLRTHRWSSGQKIDFDDIGGPKPLLRGARRKEVLLLVRALLYAGAFAAAVGALDACSNVKTSQHATSSVTPHANSGGMPTSPLLAAATDDDCTTVLAEFDTRCGATNDSGEPLIAAPLGQVFQLESVLAQCRSLLEERPIYPSLLRVYAHGTSLTITDVLRQTEHQPPPEYPEKLRPAWRDSLRDMILRGALFKALSSTRWRHSHAQPDAGSYILNAEVRGIQDDKAASEIIMYDPACDPVDVYGLELQPLDASTRYLLVAAHEFGHVIDRLSGDLPAYDVTDAEAERRATSFGAYVVECWLRGLRSDEISRMLSVSPARDRRLACLHRRWEFAESALRKLRVRWQDDPLTIPPDLVNKMGCVSTKPHEKRSR